MTKQDTFPLYTHQKLVPDYYSNYYINTTSHLKLILQEKKQKNKSESTVSTKNKEKTRIKEKFQQRFLFFMKDNKMN